MFLKIFQQKVLLYYYVHPLLEETPAQVHVRFTTLTTKYNCSARTFKQIISTVRLPTKNFLQTLTRPHHNENNTQTKKCRKSFINYRKANWPAYTEDTENLFASLDTTNITETIYRTITTQ